jgi:hypothetical protein
MDRFTRLFAALEQIFGKGFVSRLMGKQSNVITLPSKDAKKFLNTELNIAEASEAAVKKGIEDLEKLVSDTNKLSLINDQELLVITNNTERLAQRVNPKAGPDAEVINLGTKEKVSPEGIMQLKETMGQRNAPGTLMGDLEGGINKLKASSEDLSKMKGQTLDELMGDFSQGQKTMLKLEDEGLVRAAAREIISRDIKSGKIKLPKELEQDIVQGGGEPVDIWRQFYGEDALEQLDSMVPEFRNMYSPKEAADAAVKKFNFNPQLDRPPGSINIDDAKKTEKDLGIGTLKDDIEDPEKFAVGGRVGMASGGIAALKTLIRFLGKDSGKKGSQMLKEINPKQFGYKFDMLDPEMKDAVNKNRLEYLENLSNVIKADKKLLREMKDLPKEWQDFMYKQANEGGNKGRLDIYNKINIDDAIGDIEQMKKNLEFKDIPGKEIQRKMNAEGGSQGLDYLMGIERRGYAGGGESMVSPDDDMLSYEQAVEKNRQEQMGKNALASQKFDDFLKEKTGYANIDDYYQDPERLAYDPTAAEGDITKGIYDAINLEGYKPYGYEDTPFQFEFDKDPNVFSTAEYDDTGREVKRTPISSEAKQQQIKNYLENALYDQSLLDPNRFGFSKDKPTTIEGSKFFLDQLKNLQKRDPDFEKVIKEGKYIDALENKLRNLYDPGEYQKLQETLDPGYSKYAQDNLKINKAFDTSDVLANYEYKDGQRQPIDSSIYGYLSNAERDIIERSQSLPTYLTGYAQQLIQDARNRKQAQDEQDRREQTNVSG